MISTQRCLQRQKLGGKGRAKLVNKSNLKRTAIRWMAKFKILKAVD
jgi:hypothetical protein